MDFTLNVRLVLFTFVIFLVGKDKGVYERETYLAFSILVSCPEQVIRDRRLTRRALVFNSIIILYYCRIFSNIFLVDHYDISDYT